LHLENRSDSAQQGADISQSNQNKNARQVRPRLQQMISKRFNQFQLIVMATVTRLLSTIVYIENDAGHKIETKALLDNGSQSNFVSQSLCNKLNLTKRKISYSIGAIAQSVTHISEATSATIRSRVNAFSVKVSFSVLDEITENIPLVTFDTQSI